MKKVVARVIFFLCAYSVFGVSFVFSYGKEFSFRIKIEPPEQNHTGKYQVVVNGAKVNFFVEKGIWSDWTKISAEQINSIKKLYPNLYLNRYPLVIHICINPCPSETKVFFEFNVDEKQYSSQALSYASGSMVVGILQWE
ncbi:MAG: hypothetical protein NC899_03680, partial [Candidatus Omnitrophica bacterium]|nr:hypothetical protein [Candidatus Omnitrophota bacterium]